MCMCNFNYKSSSNSSKNSRIRFPNHHSYIKYVFQFLVSCCCFSFVSSICQLLFYEHKHSFIHIVYLHILPTVYRHIKSDRQTHTYTATRFVGHKQNSIIFRCCYDEWDWDLNLTGMKSFVCSVLSLWQMENFFRLMLKSITKPFYLG